jgi:hypothetical protein
MVAGYGEGMDWHVRSRGAFAAQVQEKDLVARFGIFVRFETLYGAGCGDFVFTKRDV